jgi:CCR4-NOT transcription complex subunit 7/8
LNEDVTWITFHSGYDFGYLLKYIAMEPLPDAHEKFLDMIDLYFPKFFDIKHMIKGYDYLRGGLNKLAEEMDVNRQGPVH